MTWLYIYSNLKCIPKWMKWKESGTKLTTNFWKQDAVYTPHKPCLTDKRKSLHLDSDSWNVKQCHIKTH